MTPIQIFGLLGSTFGVIGGVLAFISVHRQNKIHKLAVFLGEDTIRQLQEKLLAEKDPIERARIERDIADIQRNLDIIK